MHRVLLREAGHMTGEATLYDPENVTLVHHVNQALRAHKLFQRDKDYIVRNGKVIIIDEFTGRMMEGRRWGEGLHQASRPRRARDPARERDDGLDHLPELFPPLRQARRHDRHGADRGRGVRSIYGLDVVEVPTNVPVARLDEDDQVYRTAARRPTPSSRPSRTGARARPADAGRHDVHREVRDAVGRAEEARASRTTC
jgi:preprotein translocase subunit SecA